MKGAEEIYTVQIGGKKYRYRYPDPETHDAEKRFSGSADVWEEGSRDHFTVFVSVRADELDEYQCKIWDEIEKHIKK